MTTPSPSVSTRALPPRSTCEVYGSHTAHASTLPALNAASASAGCRYLTETSLSVSPAFLREASS
ncbi:hypothetical protein SMD44_08240 [Streptomyces alboflavus]|uniref:Uncharacterized protein n=1 Tax=Streptomyces alboflavus TaxID=67267 RepID=A0A1Z1WQN9_9ACTN|nr:hypothetical protein SMD44_08240 [Streptomyces alboflavus]